MKKRILSAFMLLCMLLTLLPVSALAADEGEGEAATVSVDSFEALKSAASSAEGSVIEVSGDIEMTETVTFANKVTLRLTETANITYSSDTITQLYLITLQDGSTLEMAEGSQVTMTGDESSQNANRDWRALYSNGSLTVTQFEGSITVENARGRGLYTNNDLVFDCPMAGTVTMNNPNGDNRYLYGIVSYAGDIKFNQGISSAGKVSVTFGNGNNGYGIAAQSGSVSVTGDIAGEIDVQMGVSHAGIGIYAAQNITVTGDISGRIYARGGSGSGYGVYAAAGDIAIAAISGSVTGDCYNKIMKNSQSGASALYAGGSIYGVKTGDEVTPLQLTGTLSSTVGRNDAFTIQAGGDIDIAISGEGSIQAQSSYGAEWTGLEDSYEEMSNNWGGTAAGAIAGGEINITGNEDGERIVVVSQSESGNPVDAGFLAETGKKENVSNISDFLYQAARGSKEGALEANAKLTDEDKALINGYDQIADDLLSVKVNSFEGLLQAISEATNGAIIVLESDIEVTNTDPAYSFVNDGVITISKSITINGNGHTIKAADNWISGEDNAKKNHIINIVAPTNSEEKITVTINNLIVNGNNKPTKNGINVATDNHNQATANLNNVEIRNCGAAGLVVNNSIVTATDLNTSGNAWYGVNVDKGSPSFTMVSGEIGETIKIVAGDTENNNITLTLPEDWATVVNSNGSMVAMPEAELGKNNIVRNAATGLYYTSIESAVKAAKENETLLVYPGAYDVTPNNEDLVQGQTGWYLPIETSITIMGVDGDGNEITDAAQTLATVYSTHESPNGAWASQNFITVFADHVTISGITIMSKDEANKTIEVDGKNFTLKNCKIAPNSYVEATTSGSLYFSGTKETVLVEGNLFEKMPLVFGDVPASETTDILIKGNTFDTPAENSYLIGNVTWSTPQTLDMADVTVEGNTFTNLPEGYDQVVLHRMGGNFILKDNTVPEGTTMTELVSFDSGRFYPGDYDGFVNAEPVIVVQENGTTTVLTPPATKPGEDEPTTEPSKTIAITPVGGEIYTGNSLALTAELTGFADNTEITWTVSGGTLTTTTGDSTSFRADTAGTYTVTATAGEYSASVTVIVEDAPTSTGGSVTRYTITIKDADYGAVKSSVSRASRGSSVTLTVTPDEGYALNSLTVTQSGGGSVSLTDKGNGKYTFTMPRANVTVEAVFAASGEQTSGLPFTDVDAEDWFYDAVTYVYENGMMEGTSATTFAPGMVLSRAMVAQVLYNLEEQPGAAADAGFPDVAAGAWYADAVNWAAEHGVVTGYDTGAFGPEDAVTREQLAVMLYRYAQYKGYDVTAAADLSVYSDAASVSAYAETAMSWAVGEELFQGVGASLLSPNTSASRAEVATILMRFTQA